MQILEEMVKNVCFWSGSPGITPLTQQPLVHGSLVEKAVV